MFQPCQYAPDIGSIIQARHEFPSVTVSRADLQEVSFEDWLGLVLDRWQPTRHGSDQPGGNMATKPNAQAWRSRGTRAVTVRVLVVDDEPDVEALFRQHFRRG